MRRKFARQRVPGDGGVPVRASNGIASSAAQPVGVRRAWLRRPSTFQAKSFRQPLDVRRRTRSYTAPKRIDPDLEITLQVAHGIDENLDDLLGPQLGVARRQRGPGPGIVDLEQHAPFPLVPRRADPGALRGRGPGGIIAYNSTGAMVCQNGLAGSAATGSRRRQTVCSDGTPDADGNAHGQAGSGGWSVNT